MHAFNPSTQEAETGESLGVQGQPGLVLGQAPKLQLNPVSKKKTLNFMERNLKKSKTYIKFSRSLMSCGNKDPIKRKKLPSLGKFEK